MKNFYWIYIIIVVILGLIYWIDNGNDRATSQTNVPADPIEIRVCQESNIELSHLRQFQDKMNGLKVAEIRTGYLPADADKYVPYFVISFQNRNERIIKWSYKIWRTQWRIATGDGVMTSSERLDAQPSIDDPIGKGCIVYINNQSNHKWVKSSYFKEGKVKIELIQDGEVILSIPIKNDFIKESTNSVPVYK